jgi:hypothetical protein
MFRLPGQDLPVKLLGVVQPPGLVVLHRQIEGLLDRELAHAVNGHYPVRIAPWQLGGLQCVCFLFAWGKTI